MAGNNIGKITQIISAVLDIKFQEGHLPEINEAIEVPLKDGGRLVVEGRIMCQMGCKQHYKRTIRRIGRDRFSF